MNTCDEKLFGYFHWYYCVSFMIFWICWPITINRLSTLPRTAYEYQWYWLGAMFIAFVIEHCIVEPILICSLGDKTAIKRRGFWYDSHLGEAYKEMNEA